LAQTVSHCVVSAASRHANCAGAEHEVQTQQPLWAAARSAGAAIAPSNSTTTQIAPRPIRSRLTRWNTLHPATAFPDASRAPHAAMCIALLC